MANSYSKYFGSNRKTHVSEKLSENQVLNNTGGYVYKLDKWAHLDRFLILGAEGGTYYANERNHVIQNYDNLLECVSENGVKVVNRIVEISQEGRAPKNDPAIFALAFVLKNGDLDARRAAAEAVPKVCRIGTHLFTLADNVQAFGGWGRVTQRAFQNWYLNKSERDLAYQLMKYQQRNGWSHRDVLRKAHPKAENEVQNQLFHWATKGWDDIGPDPHPEQPFDRIWAFEKAKKASSAKELVSLIEEYNLPHECIPTGYKTNVKVQEALLQKMPMHAMIRNLANYTRSGLLTNTSEATQLIVERLNDAEYLQRSRVHPINVLNAMKTYASGKGFRGSNTWSPVRRIVDALDAAFYKSFKNVEPTGKAILIALDVSSSMTWHNVAGMNLTPREVSAAMALVTMNVEDRVEVVGFSGNIVPINISPRMRLDDVIRVIENTRMGSTNIAAPMEWAINNGRKEFDGIVCYTDNEVNRGYHPAESLRRYRKFSGRNTKYVVAGLTATGFSVADPNDGGMFDVVGCDSATPQLIADFIAGNV